MEEKIGLFTYSVADLRNWLVHNCPVNGLSAEIISPGRAFAIMNNPFVSDDMRVVCALYVNDKLAAFTAAFPEVLQKPENRMAWWFSTLWCDKKYAGRGFGLVVIGTLCELIGAGNFFDAEGAVETVEIFKILGLNNINVPRYVFSGKSIHTNTIRGKYAWFLEKTKQIICARKRGALLNQFRKSNSYSVNYSQFVDDEAYSFMKTHSGKDLLFRKQEMFNWILQYPFVQSSPLRSHVPFDNEFSSYVEDYKSFFLHIFKEKKLVGVSLMVYSNHTLSVKYLYYSDDSAKMVFDSLIEHLLSLDVTCFQTNDAKLSEYLRSMGLFTKYEVSPRSFSFPEDFEVFEGFTLQAGEGDMFV